ncbi:MULTISPECIES: contractile injection system tape measure protein [unclassified Pedobacter]|jgi:hypothetical protein|uniref:contractile injection system tape measure protein n=1 Tax=unclassified Pedobacter TaxID=2628915 RepID=UPI000D37C8E7|nr:MULTISPECIES: contractile injection system tape measure protein [unclassified Pedobacter]PTS96271.1 hypothetical protein DBR11_19400 [Pedobacter sp. HMWF019]HWW41502.1 contractile injection system tape measure protein [Pedobacter sp.]
MNLFSLKRQSPGANGISIKNAGIVLLNNYIPMLFERLKLTDRYKFPNIQSQHQAANVLHYLMTGNSIEQQDDLHLIKVLCGLPLSEQIEQLPSIPENDKELMNNVLTAMIANWPAIGLSSIDLLRENWLLRNGSLVEHSCEWELHIEKRSYDVIINRSPFTFSVVKFPWMDNTLHVYWKY